MNTHFYKSLIALCLTVFLMGNKTSQAQYCTSNLYSFGCQYGDYIDNCSVGSIHQTGTGCSSGATGYSDYTTLSTDLEQGSIYTLTLSNGNYGEYASMWIDLNDNQVFESSERLVSYLFCSNPLTDYSTNFAIPVFALAGNHRMRVRIVPYTFPIDPCLTYSYGEIQDYTAHVIAPANMSYVSSTTTQTNSSTTSAGSPDVEMIGVQVSTSGSLNPLTLNSLTINSNGSTNFAADVSNVKIYYTGSSSVFATTNFFGSATNLSSPVSGNNALNPGTNYFWVTYDLSPTATLGDYLDAACTQLNISGAGNEIPTITSPFGSRQINYCLPNNTGGCNFAYINGITLNTLSNLQSGCNGSIDGYVNYGPIGSLTTTMEIGSSYSLTLNGPDFEPVGLAVWIDFNNDADFTDAGEFVFGSTTYATGSVSGTVNIPSTATLGLHRMRVRAKDYGVIDSSESCVTFAYGEAEDYTVTLVSPTPMTYISSTTTQNNISTLLSGTTDQEIIGIQVVTQGSLSPISLTSVTINSNGTTSFANDVSNVKVYYSGTTAIFSAGNLFGSSTTLSSPITGSQVLFSGTNYFWVSYDVSANALIGDVLDAECTQIKLSPGGNKTPSVTAPAGSRTVEYCTPATTYGCFNGFIDGVTFNTLSNMATGCNGSLDGYINYAPVGNLTTSVQIGTTYSLILEGPAFDDEGFGVWIDYNTDGDFDDADEFVYSSPFSSSGSQFGTVSIPNNSSLIGTHRMRVRSKEYNTIGSNEACSVFFNASGESEDYTITITAAGPMSYVSSTTTQDNTNPISLGQPDVEIMGIEINTTGTLSPLAVTSLAVNSNGCSDYFGDVTNAKIYYTGTSPNFATTTLFGSSTDLSSPVSGNQTLSPGVNYFWVTYDISSSGSLGDILDAECTQVVLSGAGGAHVPSVTAPAGYRVLDYCIPLDIYGCSFAYIDGVTLNTLSNLLTNCNGSINGYIQYSPSQGITTELSLGETYDLQLDGPAFESIGFGVWIDFNKDGDFDDADEFVYTSPYYTTGSQFGTINIPGNSAYLGDRRMRVRAKDYSLIYSTESCADFNYGETEDYTVTITPSVTPMTYVSSTTTQNNINSVNLSEQNVQIIGIQIVTAGAMNPLNATSFTLNATGSSNFANDVSDVKVYYTGTDPNYSPGTLFGSASNLINPITGSQQLSAGTNYFWVAYDLAASAMLGDYLDAECTQIMMDGSGGAQIPSVTAPFGSRQINLCVPTYVNPCSSGDYIDIFTLNNLSNVFSGCNGLVNNYIYYDPGMFTTDLEAGSSYTITLQSGPTYGQGFGVWIDFNNNGDFGDPGEFVYSSPTSGTQQFTSTVTIPVDPSYYGDRRLRVRCVYNITLTAGNYCTNDFFYGETEDYTVTVTPAPTCTGTPIAGVATADPDVICSAGNLSTLTVSGFTLAGGISFQWQQSANGSTWSNISNATSSNYNATINASTYYRAKVTCDNSGQTANSASAFVKLGGNEQISTSTGATVCGQGNVDLLASTTSDFVMWYTSATGGSPVYYSSSPSDYNVFVNSTTTYYAAAATGYVNISNVGPVDYSLGSVNPYYNYQFEYFDVYNNCTLEGVYVYPAAAGNVVIVLQDLNYNTLQTVTVPVTVSDINQKTYIPLNILLTPGLNYHLAWNFGSVNLYSNDYGAVYPYGIPDVLSVTGSSYGGSEYFYFYDWKVNHSNLCESAVRTPVTATATAAPAVTITPDPLTAIICDGSGQSVNLTASGPYNSYVWSPADGLSNTSGATVSANPSASTTYVLTATDGTCTNADTLMVNVVSPPSVTVSSNPDALCAGGESHLSAIAPTLTYNVSQIPFAPVTGSGSTVVLGDDEVSIGLPIGFNFSFFGNDYSDFYISSNGFITFEAGSTAGCCTGQFLPNYDFPRNLISMAWEDFAPNLGGDISYFTTGAAPLRKLIVNFKNVMHYNSGGPGVDPVTLQLIMFESSNNIEIHTTSMPGNPNGVWNPHTEGIENADGTLGFAVPGRNSDATWSATNDAWRFAPPQYVYSWTPTNSLDNSTIFNPTASPASTTTYTVTVTDNVTMCASTGTTDVNVITTPVAGTISAPFAEFCSSGQTILTLDGYSPGATIHWQDSPTSGGPYTNINSATNDTYTTPLLNTTTYYVAKVSCANDVISPEEPVIINYPPVSPTGIDSGHCGPGPVTISAIGTGNGLLNWYYSQNGNTYLGSGSPFTTPFINETTTFWVEEGQPLPAPLTTAYSGYNSQNGSMFDITAVNDVYITGFDVNLGFGTSDFEIYYKIGTFVGSETNSGNWTLAANAIGVASSGLGVATNIPANLYIHIPAGQTYGFYITSSNYNYIYYDYGSSVGTIAASDNNIQVKEGASEYYPFGYPTTSTKWNGTVHYIAPGCASPRVPVEAMIYSPQVTASASNNVICEGSTIQLSAQNQTSGNFVFQWSPAIAGMIPQDGMSEIVSVSPPVTMTFTLNVTDAAAGCDTVVQVNVTVNPIPAVFISGLNSEYLITDQSVPLNGYPAGGTFAGPGVSGNTFAPSSLAPGTYSITYNYTDANGCIGSTSQDVSVVLTIGIGGISDGYNLSLYPNPATGLFTLDLILPDPVNDVMMRVFNLIGQPVFEDDFGNVKDDLKKTFDFSQWSAGTYYIQIIMDGKTAFRKLTIQR